MDEAFYGTLPQDTRDFTQILRGVKRNLTDAARGVSYYPYDLIGAPVDIINMALTPIGLGSQQPVLGSDYLRNIAKSLGLAQDPTGSVAETTARIGAGFINPAAGARAVGQIPQQVTRGANITADKLVQMITRNPEATAPQVLQETSMPFLNAVAPKAPSLLQPQKSDLGFYSQLEAATIPLQNKGTGEQYLAQISKAPGVKPEELQWTGLDEFLKNRQSVTKAEIQDYLNANRVDVQEVRLGQNNPYADWQQKLAKAKESQDAAKINMELTLPDNLSQLNYYNLRDMWAGPAARGDQEALSKIRSLGLTPEQEANVLDYGRQVSLVSELKGSAPPNLNPKFSNYTLPGGENYREILLTLPDTKGAKLDARRAEIEAKGLNATDAEKQEWASIMNQLQPETRDVDGLSPFRNRPEFRSTHFNQPNILAHMRANDRVVDGKNTLFIEEIQSDWHQAGRKKGYADAQKPWEVFDPVTAEVVGKYASQDEARAAKIELNKAGGNFDIGKSEGVPDAPFKTSWHELALKRAIQEASEKGYDQIAFTTGKTQAERYDLSKQIGQITARPTPDGKVSLEALTPDMREQVISRVVNVDELDDIVGKEISDKIRTQIRFPQNFDDRGKSVELSGLDLQVGGEGMKGFYDNILPKSLDKLGKKFGAKVGKTEMDGVEVWTMPITPEMRQSVTTKGQPLFAIPAIGTGLLGEQLMQEDQF